MKKGNKVKVIVRIAHYCYKGNIETLYEKDHTEEVLKVDNTKGVFMIVGDETVWHFQHEWKVIKK